MAPAQFLRMAVARETATRAGSSGASRLNYGQVMGTSDARRLRVERPPYTMD
jgi:hypothetical protein